ncbi:MAG: toprim domain-containing protein [Synergistaceae bacterium]|nr:toprim domain-containing protein [Synergistaceae bacterium]
MMDRKKTHADAAARTSRPAEEKAPDYAAYFRECQARISETDYPQRRGLSAEVVKRFGLGYDPRWKNPKAPSAPTTPRLIIPTGEESYTARDTRDDLTERQKEFSKMRAGKIRVFNVRALKEARKPVFVVESEIDALSILEVGGEAVSLGSIEFVTRFLGLLEREKPKQRLIIALDNDPRGNETARDLARGLAALEIPFYRHVWEGYKDANEALLGDRDAFREKIQAAEEAGRRDEEAERENYLQTSAARHLQNFMSDAVDGLDALFASFIPTGFKKLDRILDGGLFEGLYILGATGSNGKTSFALQIADQIARAGNDVLFFSLEMSRFELMAKSISRETFLAALRTDGDMKKARTARGVTTGTGDGGSRGPEEKKIVEAAMKTYGEYAGHIYISEGMGDTGTEQIREETEKHFSFTGNRPVVLIDCLQILAPGDSGTTDKQNMDKAAIDLKRISRDFRIPVLGIASFNRVKYGEAATMEAFGESEALEYSSDVVTGLQLRGAGEKNFDPDRAKDRDLREMELVILKNRNGPAGKRIDFEYYPLFNYFRETGDQTAAPLLDQKI